MNYLTSIKFNVPLFLGIITIFGLALLIQVNSFLNCDVSLLMHGGKLMLAGGKYYSSFFETNPPMAIYIYLPAVLLAKGWAINFITAVRIYIFAVAIFTLLLCASLLRQLLFAKDKKLYGCLLLALAFVFVLLPGGDFGQRENMMLMLIMPYLLLISLRLQNIKINPIFCVLIGVLGMIGFLVKPFFLLAWIFVEGYFFSRTIRKLITHGKFSKQEFTSSIADIIDQKGVTPKKWRTLLRGEFIVASILLVSYIASIFLFTPEYPAKVVPLTRDCYYFIFATSWHRLWYHPWFVILCATLFFYGVLRKYSRYPALSDILLLAVVALTGIYFLQRMLIFYHVYPALAVALLLQVILLYEFVREHSMIHGHTFFFAWPSFAVSRNGATKDSARALFRLMALVGSGCAILFIIATAYGTSALSIGLRRDPVSNQLITLSKTYAQGQAVAFFTNYKAQAYPLVDYAGAEPTSYLRLWMLPGILHLAQLGADQQPRLLRIKTYLTDLIVTDFNRQRPVLVFVAPPEKMRFPWGMMRVDYLGFFLADERFREIWKNYIYMENIGPYTVYRRKYSLNVNNGLHGSNF